MLFFTTQLADPWPIKWCKFAKRFLFTHS